LVEYGISVDDAAARQQCDNTTEYVCANGHTCIALELVNNTVNDCGDNSDEGK